VLARQIRQEAFAPLDAVLVSYVQALNQNGIDLMAASAKLGASSVIDAAMKGGAVGQVAGGFGGSGKTLGALNALMQAGVEADKKLTLIEQRVRLLKQAENLALTRIAIYVAEVTKLAERLLDYGCARSFGAQVSLERQKAALDSVLGAIADELKIAVNLTLALPEAEKRVEQERLLAGQAQEEARRKHEEMDFKKREPAVGVFFVALSVGLAAWPLHGCNPDTADEGNIVLGLVLLLCAIAALVFGIMKFFDRRPPSATNANPGSDSPGNVKS
jgi:hypothetical protein